MYGLCVGCGIKDLREAKGITARDLAEELGLSAETVSAWDCNERLEISHLPMLARYFGVSIDQLFIRKVCVEMNAKCPYLKGKRADKMDSHVRAARKLGEFKGDEVYCPCCGKSFSVFQKFEPTGGEHCAEFFENTRLDVICPVCQSSPRHRIICLILENIGISLEDTLLFAPNPGIIKWFERNGYGFSSADLYDRTADLRIDLQNTELPDESFNFISCDHVLEHVRSFPAALSELYRIVKKGGHVEITVPILPSLAVTYEDDGMSSAAQRMAAFGQYDHLRVFGRDFKDRLSDAGFKVAVYDGDDFDPKIMPITAPAVYDSNKVFICERMN